jgi:tRNA G46 methylase TrmB
MSDLSLPKTQFRNECNPGRLAWDLSQNEWESYAKYWVQREYPLFPPEIFLRPEPLWLEIGAGSGWFFVNLASHYPDRYLIAVERCKMRGQRLIRKAGRSGLGNVAGFRGNAIPALIQAIPDQSLERIYLLYPCPWPKTAQRRNRWYLHPVMPHLLRVLRPGGKLIWASDQKFYIDEAQWVCQNHFKMRTLSHGVLSPNPYNDLELFPGGRTKFEQTFLKNGLPCYELIAEKE